MGKSLYIAEKPSVAAEFAKALKENFTRADGYNESDNSVVTWCVGHLVTMSYPEAYDPALAKWSYDTVPFLPKEFKYEIIPNVAKQFNIVKGLLNRPDVTRIYVCTDSGREGEYIYRLVDRMAQVPDTKDKRRVWIDSQTEEEVLRGIREAKPLSAYNSLSDAAYLRAKEDYLMGINFSRILTLKYGKKVRDFLNIDKGAISVGRVMTCVLGMVVRREREIRAFTKTPFYRVVADLDGAVTRERSADPSAAAEAPTGIALPINAEFRAAEGSKYRDTPFMYKENAFKKRETAVQMIEEVSGCDAQSVLVNNADNAQTGNTDGARSDSTAGQTACSSGMVGGQIMKKPGDVRLAGIAEIVAVNKSKENKPAPLLFNLAELQNECSRRFKISPDETLNITQELYEKKLVTYPRTDARVLSTAVAKEIDKNIKGLSQLGQLHEFAAEILEKGTWKGIAKTKYTNDKQITDHYAIIPTGQGFQNLSSLKPLQARVYELICRRFLSIFFPPVVYRKVALTVKIGDEQFFANFKALMEEGWMKVAGRPQGKQDADKQAKKAKGQNADSGSDENTDDSSKNDDDEQQELGVEVIDRLEALKKGMKLDVCGFEIRLGETSPPKRYNSGSMILAMENAGQLIEDEDLRAQIRGSGIGTSATRAEILNKLVRISYLALNKKTQIITPTQQGEMIYEVVNASMRSLLNPELTASWEKGLTGVAEGKVTSEEYMAKLESFVAQKTNGVKQQDYSGILNNNFAVVAQFYDKR